MSYTCSTNCQKVARLGHCKVHSLLRLPSFSAKWTSVVLVLSSALLILEPPRPQHHPPGPHVSSHRSPAAASWTAGTGCSGRTARPPWGPGRRCPASWRCASRSGPPSSWRPPRLRVAGTRWWARLRGRSAVGREQLRCGLRVPVLQAGWLADSQVFPPPAVFYLPPTPLRPPHLKSSREESLGLWTWGHTNQLRGRTLGPAPWPRSPERPGPVTLERRSSGALGCQGQGWEGAQGGGHSRHLGRVGWRGLEVAPLGQVPGRQGLQARPDSSLFTTPEPSQCHAFLARNCFQESRLWESIGACSERDFYSSQSSA